MYLCDKENDKIVIYQMTEKWNLIKKFNKEELDSIPSTEKVCRIFRSQESGATLQYDLKYTIVTKKYLKTLIDLYCFNLCDFSLFSLNDPDSNKLYFAYPTKQDLNNGAYALHITKLLYLLTLLRQGRSNLSNYNKEEMKKILSLFDIKKIASFSQKEFQNYGNIANWFNQKSEHDKLILKLVKDKKDN